MIIAVLCKIVCCVSHFQIQDELIITHLLIPKQNGSLDFCQTENGQDVFEYVEENDLTLLG
jgi:hypothetical protein